MKHKHTRQKAPQRVAGKKCVDRCQSSPRSSSSDHGAKTTGREPEVHRIDVLQVVFEPNLRWSNACLIPSL